MTSLRLNALSRHALVSAALAATLGAGWMNAAHAEGLYLGANLSAPDWRTPINDTHGDSKGAGVNLYGGVQLNRNVSVELGAMTLGHLDARDGAADIKAHGGYLDLVGTVPLAPQLSAIGRIGYTRANFVSSAGSDNGDGLKLGAGLQYDLSSRVALRGEWNRYRLDAYGSGNQTDQYSLGVKVGF